MKKIAFKDSLTVTDETKDYTFFITNINYNCRFYNNKSTFDSVYELGQNLLSALNVDNYNEIDGLLIKKNYILIENILNEWLSENPFPYKSIKDDKLEFYVAFTKDCIFCYSIYNIVNWILKIYKMNNKDYDDIIESDFNTACFKLQSELIFLDFFNYINQLLPSNIYVNIDNESADESVYNSLLINFEDIILIPNKTDNDEKFDNTNCNMIRVYLCDWILNKIKENDLYVYNDKLYYIAETDHLNIGNSTYSLMGIAYNYLLKELTQTLNLNRTDICHNPSCCNRIDTTKGRKYCDNVECQKYRNNLKSRNYKTKHKQKSK